MSTKNDILNGLVTQVKTIKAGMTYDTSVGDVERAPIHFSEHKENTPFVSLIQLDDDILYVDSTAGYDARLLRIEMNIYFKKTQKDADEEMATFIGDLRKVLLTTGVYDGTSLDTDCARCRMTREDGFYYIPQTYESGFRLELEIVYYDARS